jgi:hypothetical protein
MFKNVNPRQNFPELENEHFILQHKYDGTNISLILEKGKPTKLASRNQIMGNVFEANHMGSKEVFQEHTLFLIKLEDWFNTSQYDSLHLYGELYGRGIQKRVNYGQEKYIKFFDSRFNGELNSPYVTNGLLDLIDRNYKTENFGFVNGLINAIDFDCSNIKVNNTVIEGIVIKPYHKVYQTSVGETFMIKKKNEEFKEKMGVSTTVAQMDASVIKFNLIFKSYITESRLMSVFSKEGEIKDRSEIGKYIVLFMNDAKEDFLKENDISYLSDKEKKSVFNIGNLAAKLVTKFI